MKKACFLFLVLFSASPFFGDDAFSLVPESSDFAVELIPAKALKVKKLAEILNANPDYAALKTAFAAQNIDLEKSVKKAVLTGDYKQNSSLIFDTSIPEKDFLSLIADKNPETFNFSGQKVHKYFKGNKAIFAAYIRKNIIVISENPSLIADAKRIDFNKITKEKFPQAETAAGLARAYFRNLAKAAPEKGKGQKRRQKQEIDPRSLMGDAINEAMLALSSPDKILLEATGYLLADAQHEKLLRFQANTLFLLLVTQISSGNQKLANQMTDSFEVSSEGGVVKVNFKLDTSLLHDKPNESITPTEDFLDPFAN